MKCKKLIKEYLCSITIAVVLALAVRASIVQASKVQGSSMEPTLLSGDYLLVNKLIYGIKIPFIDKKILTISAPKRGDIIVLKYPNDPSKDFVKRVIAVGGDTVEILRTQVYVNGFPIQDPHGYYIYDEEDGQIRRDNFGPVTVPDGAVFCLGDNRDRSSDSREWGFVDMNLIRGKASILHFSWDVSGASFFDKVRWSRIGMVLDE